jgi:hypothetical protein
VRIRNTGYYPHHLVNSAYRRHQEGDAADVRRSVLHSQQQDHSPRHEGRQHSHHQTGLCTFILFLGGNTSLDVD